MKQVLILGIRNEKTRMKVTPPLAVAPITQDDDMRWNPNDLMQQRSFSKRMTTDGTSLDTNSKVQLFLSLFALCSFAERSSV